MTTEKNAPAASSSQEGNDSQARKPASKPPSDNKVLKYWYLIVILLLIVAVAGTYVWKNMEVARAKADLTQRAEQVIGEQNKTYLQLVAVPLAWAVRSEMIRDNYDQVNQYLAQFIKEKNMKELVVARPDGKVVAATNKKLEGASITDSFPAEVLQVESTTLTTRDNGEIMVVSPVMGLSEKVGVLVLVYKPVTLSLEPNP